MSSSLRRRRALLALGLTAPLAATLPRARAQGAATAIPPVTGSREAPGHPGASRCRSR